MKQMKQGISLMVLILTVIIMVILAGTVIISLNNAGIINRSQGAVDEYNLKQVDELANLAWGEAYLAGNTTQSKLKEYVINYLTKNGVDTTKYYIAVTTKGVAVQDYVEYEKNGWYKAWTCTNEIWSDEIEAGGTLNGDVIAKLYKTDEENKYDLIIEGNGKMGPIRVAYEDEITEWIKYKYVAYIGSNYNNKLRNVTIKEGVTTIGEYAFYMSSIESIKIAESISTIECGAFADCRNLDSITIPQNTSFIDFRLAYYEGSGSGTKPFKCDITIDENNKTYKVIDGMVCSKDGKTLYYGIDIGETIVIPDGVVIIEKEALALNENARRVKIPSTVTTIKDGAFAYCEILNNIVFPNSVTNFGKGILYHYGLGIITMKIYATSINSIEKNFNNCNYNTFGSCGSWGSKIYVLNEDVKNQLAGSYDDTKVEVIVVDSVEAMDTI